jgi:hypothetical protein
MMRIVIVLLVLASALTAIPRPAAVGAGNRGLAAALPPDVAALLQHIDDLYRSKSSIARI